MAVTGSRELDAIYDKIAWRIMPFLVLLFIVAWLDRINVGFARLQMVKDLGFSERHTDSARASSISATCCSRFPAIS